MLAGQAIRYESVSPDPKLRFAYNFETKNCYYNVQRSDALGSHIFNSVVPVWQSCYDEFLALVREEHPSFDLSYQYNDSNNISGLPIGAVKSFSSFFRLTLWWTILHIFYTMIPGYKL